MSQVTIEIGGESVELDAELLKGYRDEAFEILGKEAEAKADFKKAMEAQAEGLSIDKKVWQKYVKSAFKAKTREARELGEAFAALDGAMEEKLELGND